MLTLYVFHVFFFVKQKTAYEMRISDWSSDVCSSELQRANDGARDILLQRSGGLRVVASPSVGHYVIPNTIKALHDRIPEIQLEIEVQTANELVKNVASGHAELGVVNLHADHPRVEDRKSTRLNSSH